MLEYLCILLNARFARLDARGSTVVEYALLIAGICALVVVVMFSFGSVLRNLFQHTCQSVGQSSSGGPGGC